MRSFTYAAPASVAEAVAAIAATGPGACGVPEVCVACELR